MRWIARLLILLFVIALLLAIFAPTFLSTTLGKKAFYQTLKNFSGYEIHADTLELSWLKGQSASKIVVLNSKREVVFQADAITSTSPLWKLLFFHDVGNLHIQSPFAVIDTSQQLASKMMMRQGGFIPSSDNIQKKKPLSKTVLGEISVTHGSAQFVYTGLENILMKDVELQAVFLPQQIKLASSGLTEQAAVQGTFHLDLLAYPATDQISAEIQLSSFPAGVIDQLVSIVHPAMKGVLRETMGESFDVDLKLKNLKETVDVYFKARSDHFNAHLETSIQDDTLQLAAPAIFQLEVPSSSFEKISHLTIKNNLHLQLKIDELFIPLQHRDSLKIQATLRSEALQFKGWTLAPLALYLGSSAFDKGEWNVKIDSSQLQFQGIFKIPEKLDHLSFVGEARLPYNTQLDLTATSLQSMTLAFQGDLGKGHLQLALDPVKKTLSILEPASLSFNKVELPFKIAPFPAEMTLEPTVIHLSPFSGIIKGEAHTAGFPLASSLVGATSLQFRGNIETKSLHFILLSSVDQGTVNVEGDFTYPSPLKVKGSCSHLPLASLEPFLVGFPPLTPLLGGELTTYFQADLSSHNQYVQITSSSPLLTLKAALKGNDQGFELIEPAQFTWTLAPDGYTALMHWLQQPEMLMLSQPALFQGSVTSLAFSFERLFETLEYQSHITSQQLEFSQNQKNNKISNLQITLSRPLPSAPHQFQISAVAPPQGSLSCQGVWNRSGTADIMLSLSQFPSATFDLFSAPFIGNRFSFSTLCGPLLNISLTTSLDNWSGPLDVKLHAAHLQSSLKGTLKQGVLTLTDTFHLQFDITNELSEMLFKQLNPMDLKSVRSKGPITLEIAPFSFSFPLFPFDVSKIQIGAGRLELGKILCRNEGNIQMTLGLLKLGSYQNTDELELWFAPLDFKIESGVLNYERTEILISQNFQICSWGKVNFPDDRIDAILGLTANCLKNAFGIQNLPENYVLQIPLQGTLTDAKLDKGKATAKISALLIWQQKDNLGGIVKGKAGKFLGETLNKLGPLPGGDQKAPPPKKPFPWENAPKAPPSKKKTSSTIPGHKKHVRQEDSALKQALKLF